MQCPRCGAAMERDTIDVGAGDVPIGPWGCPECHYVERSQEETLDFGEDDNERR